MLTSQVVTKLNHNAIIIENNSAFIFILNNQAISIFFPVKLIKNINNKIFKIQRLAAFINFIFF